MRDDDQHVRDVCDRFLSSAVGEVFQVIVRSTKHRPSPQRILTLIKSIMREITKDELDLSNRLMAVQRTYAQDVQADFLEAVCEDPPEFLPESPEPVAAMRAIGEMYPAINWLACLPWEERQWYRVNVGMAYLSDYFPGVPTPVWAKLLGEWNWRNDNSKWSMPSISATSQPLIASGSSRTSSSSTIGSSSLAPKAGGSR